MNVSHDLFKMFFQHDTFNES